ncbi:MAG: dTDP-4-dehydrorhamnose reductase [Acidithiobacillus sp.]|nr:dTDP-4-dehydrorhamnose reductase [Acidithiobacillus sp.]
MKNQAGQSRILLLGANGQLGWELRRSLLPLGEVLPLTRGEADLADGEGLLRLLDLQQPTVIVNAAAYTAVDRAESEPEQALRINGEAPGLLARWAAVRGVWLVHYSTDYVFDGRKDGAYVESDPVHPMSVYGRSKRAGEEAILAAAAPAVILRTSWVYAARGQNFARTILRLAAERESLQVVADQWGAPTSAELLADATALILWQLLQQPRNQERAGIYHLSAQGETSWHGYAQYLLAAARDLGWSLRCAPEAVEAIPSTAYPVPAPRPANSRLDCRKVQERFGLYLPPWQLQVRRLLEELRP